MKALLWCALALPALGISAPQGESLSPGAHRFAVEGVNLWYRVAGQAVGDPVVFLHGGPGEGSQTFAHFAGPALERTLRMVYLDQRGSGRSDRPQNPKAYSIALLVDDIEALRRHLAVSRIALIGHSFGTILALEYAAKYPLHVSRVVLASAVPELPRLVDIQCARLQTEDAAAYARAVGARAAGAFPRCNAFDAYPGDAQAAFVQRNMFPNPAVGREVDAIDAADGLRNTGELGGALMQQGLLDYTFRRTADVVVPVLVIAGERDFQAPQAPQSDLAKALAHGRLLIYPGLGHFTFVEDPDRFARDVSAFLTASALRP